MTIYSLVIIDYSLLVISVTNHHAGSSLFKELLWMSPILVMMAFLPFWIYLLVYGLTHSLEGVPLILIAPPGHVILTSTIIALWVLQMIEAFRLGGRCN